MHVLRHTYTSAHANPPPKHCCRNQVDCVTGLCMLDHSRAWWRTVAENGHPDYPQEAVLSALTNTTVPVHAGDQ